MRLFDSHCHLEDPAFDPDREEVIERARRAGLVGIVTSPLGAEEGEKSLSLFRRSDLVLVSVGIDPEDELSREEVDETISFIEEVADEIVAVGEVGLDYRVARESWQRERQKETFSRFIRLAEELDKPIVVHSLWAQRPALRVLDREGASRVLLHAFGGTPEDVKFAAERGWMISVGTNVVRSTNVQRVARSTPLENLCLESDSPVLAPEPRERNEPANISKSVRFLAKMLDLEAEELADIATENSGSLYGV
ncbi:MAG: hypothetical protein DRO06_02550 [Thermoproteota archaeon]|nr:MAG: hypothetical protein DRO06_02550 [Candidatus Korarchaeota archaeon]